LGQARTVPAYYRVIRWVTDDVDVSKPGKVTIKGVFTDKLEGLDDLNDKINPTCEITIAAVNDLLRQMMIKMNFMKVIIMISYEPCLMPVNCLIL